MNLNAFFSEPYLGVILSFESVCGWKFREIVRASEPGNKGISYLQDTSKCRLW